MPAARLASVDSADWHAIVEAMVRLIEIEFADPEFEKSFRVYSNYLEDLAGVIGGRYGLEETLILGIQEAMRAHGPLRRVRKHRADTVAAAGLERALQKAWSMAGRVSREVESADYDEEANAWLPEQAYYAVHHGMRAVILAATGRAPSDHRKILNVISREVVDRRLIFPWSTYCSGCPQLRTERFTGVDASGKIEVLSSPDPSTVDERIAKLLATTRKKELERRFRDLRQRKPQEGRSRRNLSSAEKTKVANNLQPTTIFDLFFRTRKKVHYDEPDVFVLGAAGTQDARRFAESLAIVTDGTLAVLECLVATYAGRKIVASAASSYAERKDAGPATLLGRRAAAWASRVSARGLVA